MTAILFSMRLNLILKQYNYYFNPFGSTEMFGFDIHGYKTTLLVAMRTINSHIRLFIRAV